MVRKERIRLKSMRRIENAAGVRSIRIKQKINIRPL